MSFGTEDWFLLLAQGVILILATLGYGRPSGGGAGHERRWLMGARDNMAQQKDTDFGFRPS